MKITYRPEIDGLRAIAVVAVILYHTQIIIFDHQPFKGGFIGVDIFFVISGYLITYIILNELLTTGKFSFFDFYERRIRRILPALLTVMLVSVPFAWMYLIPSSLIDYSKSIIFSQVFGSNFYFHYSGQQYGAENGLLKPFLHTWSLAVEEQFYILFPLILFIVFKYFRKNFLIFFIIIFILSILIADLFSRYYTSSTFYLLHARIWELLAGSVLAFLEIKLGHRNKNYYLGLVLPGIGLILIILNIVFFKLHFRHPSLYTLPAIIGVCLIIWFSTKDEIITKILSSKIFIGIGLISYSLYLWHYPILAFDRIIEFSHGSIIKKLIIGILILSLSIISYFFIEKPARNKKYDFKIIIYILVIINAVLIFSNSNIILKDGYKNRLPKIVNKNLLGQRSDRHWDILENSDGIKCHNNINGCKFNISSKNKVYFIGDSHMSSLLPNLKDRIVNKNYQFITSTFDGCIYFPGFNYVEFKTKKIDLKFNDKYFKNLEETLLQEKNSIIIIGGRFPLYLTNYLFNNQEGGIEGKKWRYKYISTGKFDTIQASFRDSVLKLSQHNKIILIYPIPEVGWNVPKKLWYERKNKFSNKLSLKNITTSYEVYKNRNETSFKLLDSIKGENIKKAYPHKLFCNTLFKNRCITHDEKNIFYADDDHPSLKGTEMINNLIMKEINNIELKSN